jgi:hypothetical protein
MHTEAMIATHPHRPACPAPMPAWARRWWPTCASASASTSTAPISAARPGSVASRRTGVNGDVVRRLIDACAEACRLRERACREASITLGLSAA